MLVLSSILPHDGSMGSVRGDTTHFFLLASCPIMDLANSQKTIKVKKF
jgi:hypothetical protein